MLDKLQRYTCVMTNEINEDSVKEDSVRYGSPSFVYHGLEYQKDNEGLFVCYDDVKDLLEEEESENKIEAQKEKHQGLDFFKDVCEFLAERNEIRLGGFIIGGQAIDFYPGVIALVKTKELNASNAVELYTQNYIIWNEKPNAPRDRGFRFRKRNPWSDEG